MRETHPFGDFIPKKTRYLMIGSFVTKPSHPYAWFYANGRNQFWPIMQEVYTGLYDTKDKQQQLFTDLEMALTDIIYSCERRNNSNLDINLVNIVYNTQAINSIIATNPLEKIFFTSKYVETLFRRQFRDTITIYSQIMLVGLPSSSPRYAMLTKQEKVQRYKALLPKLSA
jgi:hypoxanthine-DNA glycosylase